jgi:cyclopropane-fatty-acyl-phospholipid synthase
LFVTDIEILRLHYADTLRAWRERFMARRDEAAKLYDERFCRMWEFYLAGSETSFRVDGNMVFQIQLAKRQEDVPLTRDYILEREAELRRREAARPGVRQAAE